LGTTFSSREAQASRPEKEIGDGDLVHGMLAYFAVLTLGGLGKRVISVGGAMLLVTLIGFSRAYLSAHFVSDVVGGFAAGGAWLSAVITAREAMRRRDVANRRVQKSSP